MIRVPFIDASARITSVIIKTGQDDQTPRKMKVVSEGETRTRFLADSRQLLSSLLIKTPWILVMPKTVLVHKNSTSRSQTTWQNTP